MALSPAIGARLVRALVQWHVIPGEPDSLMRFWLTFHDVGSFGFAVGEDRAALDVLAEDPDGDGDLGRYGRLEVRPAGPADAIHPALGERLCRVERLDGTASRLVFESVTVAVEDRDSDLAWTLDASARVA